MRMIGILPYVSFEILLVNPLSLSLSLQIALSRYYLQTLDPKVGTICILGAPGSLPQKFDLFHLGSISEASGVDSAWRFSLLDIS